MRVHFLLVWRVRRCFFQLSCIVYDITGEQQNTAVQSVVKVTVCRWVQLSKHPIYAFIAWWTMFSQFTFLWINRVSLFNILHLHSLTSVLLCHE